MRKACYIAWRLCVCRPEDKTTKQASRDVSAELLLQIINENGLEDIGTVLTPEDQANFTHFQGVSHARLDRMYVPVELVQVCCSYQIRHVSFSDHPLVMATVGRKKKSGKIQLRAMEIE